MWLKSSGPSEHKELDTVAYVSDERLTTKNAQCFVGGLQLMKMHNTLIIHCHMRT